MFFMSTRRTSSQPALPQSYLFSQFCKLLLNRRPVGALGRQGAACTNQQNTSVGNLGVEFLKDF